MKLRNKKTGEIPEKIETIAYIQWSKKIMMIYINSDGERIMKQYDSLETFNEEWEDYEEQKEWYWFIEDNGVIQRSCHYEDLHPTLDKARKEIGNYFETKEEAERAVEKLKAWKRLKDYNVKFNLDFVKNKIYFNYTINNPLLDVLDGEEQIFNNMKIVFGGEE
jgi:hypothetical protein